MNAQSDIGQSSKTRRLNMNVQSGVSQSARPVVPAAPLPVAPETPSDTIEVPANSATAEAGSAGALAVAGSGKK